MEVSPLSPPVIVPVADASQVGDARRRAVQMASIARFSEEGQGRVAIVASELAANLARYAQHGELHLVCHGDRGSIDLISVDRGPGMFDVPRCLTDGYSTGGTPGNGLGAARRLARQFDIYSTPPTGTVILCRMADGPPGDVKGCFVCGVVAKPAPHEFVNGDACRIVQDGDRLAIAMADGLGHGPHAAVASAEAMAEFESDPFRALPAMLESCHRRMRGTRGAAVACAQLTAPDAKLRYAGIGNIAGQLRTLPADRGQGLLSHNGTVGVLIRKCQDVTYDCPSDGLLIMHSDGLQSRWNLDTYPGLAVRHPALIAAVLYRDATRGRDDVTVAAIRFSLAGVAGRHAA